MSVSGKFLTAKIGSLAVVGLVDWEAEEHGDDLDATVGNSGGATNTDTGCDDLTVTLSGVIDTTTGQYAAISRGVILSNLKLYRAATDTTPAFTVPSAIITQSTQTARARGRVEFRSVAKNKGVWTKGEPGT